MVDWSFNANTEGSMVLIFICAKSLELKYLANCGLICTEIVNNGIEKVPWKSNWTKNWYWDFGKYCTLTAGTMSDFITLTHNNL